MASSVPFGSNLAAHVLAREHSILSMLITSAAPENGPLMPSHQELTQQVLDRLRSMNDGQRAMFACSVAERLMGQHEALPSRDQRPFTTSLRPLLNAAWAMACGDQTMFAEIKRGLGAYYLSDYCHNEGQDGPGDADHDPAAAVLYAAEYAMHGCLDFAAAAARRGTDAAYHADLHDGQAPDANTTILVYPARRSSGPGELARQEFGRQLADLDFLEQYAGDLRFIRGGADVSTIGRLEREVRSVLSR